ncbi:MAG TPA: UDP-galactopyranose mutase [Anaeromyxobacteraceae bacterium]|nr:UDP-galactopyranose mutase [Anaeromyxobacteraceae bacterium]
MKTYDYIIVGSGLFGAVFAQQVHEAGHSALVIEKRSHVGGNCYSYEYEDTGIIVHAYGTHIFHTSDPRIWRYVNRFTEFNRYQHRVLAMHQDSVFPLPINLGTINAFFGVNLRPVEAESFLAHKRKPIANPRNLEEKALALIGRELYEAFIKGYTIKQWGCDPRDLPAAIITRLPIRTSFQDSYFDDVYQGVPVRGYSPMFARLLEGIPVELGTDFLKDRSYWSARARRIVYTGPIDRYFDHALGHLNWRSVRFELERHRLPDYQGTSVMNFPDQKIPYTRVHEPKHLHPERAFNWNDTVIAREYPWNDPSEPYYPVNSETDHHLYSKYEKLAKTEPVLFGGRLARYKYFDMHQVVGSALAAARDHLQPCRAAV